MNKYKKIGSFIGLTFLGGAVISIPLVSTSCGNSLNEATIQINDYKHYVIHSATDQIVGTAIAKNKDGDIIDGGKYDLANAAKVSGFSIDGTTGKITMSSSTRPTVSDIRITIMWNKSGYNLAINTIAVDVEPSSFALIEPGMMLEKPTFNFSKIIGKDLNTEYPIVDTTSSYAGALSLQFIQIDNPNDHSTWTEFGITFFTLTSSYTTLVFYDAGSVKEIFNSSYIGTTTTGFNTDGWLTEFEQNKGIYPFSHSTDVVQVTGRLGNLELLDSITIQ